MDSNRLAVVVGAGVIGSATAHVLVAKGFRVVGVDPLRSEWKSFPGETSAAPFALSEASLAVICVPTPTTAGRFDSAHLLSALTAVQGQPARQSEQLVLVRSTLMPGTMREVVRPALARRVASGEIEVAYWPSFARERSATEDELHPRSTVIGFDGPSSWRPFLREVCAVLEEDPIVLTEIEAEFVKHGANAFNATKISFFNAMSDWVSKAGGTGQDVAAAIATVAEANWNPSYGTRVGPAFGGACLPKDLSALIEFLSASGSPHVGLPTAVKAINESEARESPR